MAVFTIVQIGGDLQEQELIASLGDRSGNSALAERAVCCLKIKLALSFSPAEWSAIASWHSACTAEPMNSLFATVSTSGQSCARSRLRATATASTEFQCSVGEW
jgi:hypothetical protein